MPLHRYALTVIPSLHIGQHKSLLPFVPSKKTAAFTSFYHTYINHKILVYNHVKLPLAVCLIAKAPRSSFIHSVHFLHRNNSSENLNSSYWKQNSAVTLHLCLAVPVRDWNSMLWGRPWTVTDWTHSFFELISILNILLSLRFMKSSIIFFFPTWHF